MEVVAVMAPMYIGTLVLLLEGLCLLSIVVVMVMGTKAMSPKVR